MEHVMSISFLSLSLIIAYRSITILLKLTTQDRFRVQLNGNLLCCALLFGSESENKCANVI